MAKIVTCTHCKKEVPIPEYIPQSDTVKEMLAAPLNSKGEPIPARNKLKFSKPKKEFRCYYCGNSVEVPKASKPVSKYEPKATPQDDPIPKPYKKSGKSKKGLWIGIGVIVVVLFFCFKGCGGKSDSSSTDDLSYSSVEYNASDNNDANIRDDNGATEVGKGTTLQITDYSKEWTALQNRLDKLGEPLDYVNSQKGKDPSKIKSEAYDTYTSIKDDAYDLYQKIKDQHYDRYQKLKDAKYAEYEKIKDAAYSRYQNKEIEYSQYSDIQSEAYRKYSDIQSNAYKAYSDVQTKAYNKYSTLQSEAYNWQSKVSSITYGL